MNYKKWKGKIISQIPICLVLFDLLVEGVIALDKAESRRFLSKGNQLLNAGQLADALTQYHAAIDADSSNYQAFYMRATVYLAMSKARSALPDLNEVIKLQPTFVKARLQRGNLLMKMGRFNEAQTDYEAVLSREDNPEATNKVEEIRPLRRNVNHATQLINAKQFRQAAELLNQVIDSCPWNADFRELRASAYEQTGELRKAISDLKPTTVLRLDNTKAYLKMSVLWYRLGDISQSLDEIRECLKLDPDQKECYAHYKRVKKLVKAFESGKKLMAEESWTEAIEKLQGVLKKESSIIPLTVEVKLKICECFMKNGEHEEAAETAADVIDIEDDNIPAHMISSDAHTALEDYERAVDDLRRAMEIDENYPGLAEKLKKAQKMLKQSKKRDYYKILGVARNARKQEITKAYRKLAREWHPDNFKDEKEKANAETKFIEIAAAKEVLSDPEKRKQFDSGVDPLDPEEQANGGGGRHQGFNPFGHGGSFHFNFGGGHGGFHGFHDEF